MAEISMDFGLGKNKQAATKLAQVVQDAVNREYPSLAVVFRGSQVTENGTFIYTLTVFSAKPIGVAGIDSLRAFVMGAISAVKILRKWA
jgi:hypothetical protein